VVEFGKFKVQTNNSLKIGNISMKEGSLFGLFCFVLFVLMRSTERGMFQIPFLISLESSKGGGVHGLGFMAFGLVV
jgi:hypothetical protein